MKIRVPLFKNVGFKTVQWSTEPNVPPSWVLGALCHCPAGSPMKTPLPYPRLALCKPWERMERCEQGRLPVCCLLDKRGQEVAEIPVRKWVYLASTEQVGDCRNGKRGELVWRDRMEQPPWAELGKSPGPLWWHHSLSLGLGKSWNHREKEEVWQRELALGNQWAGSSFSHADYEIRESLQGEMAPCPTGSWRWDNKVQVWKRRFERNMLCNCWDCEARCHFSEIKWIDKQGAKKQMSALK